MVSQEKKILTALLRGKKLTPLSALKQFNCLRLSARIFDLKKKGFSIGMDLIKRDKKFFAEYFLEV